MIQAEVIPSKEGLTIQFTATGEDETRIRRMFNLIRDDGDVSCCIENTLDIAADAVFLIEKHQNRLY